MLYTEISFSVSKTTPCGNMRHSRLKRYAVKRRIIHDCKLYRQCVARLSYVPYDISTTMTFQTMTGITSAKRSVFQQLSICGPS